MIRWPVVQLGEVISHRNGFVLIDDLIEYKRCRVQLHAQGILLRDTVSGAEIKTKKQQVCKAGDFLVAEIDAKVGGFGIVPDELDGAIVSSHYFLFEINEEKLNRQFLDYFSKTPAFRDQVAAQGSTNYAAIRPNQVLAYEIPLPSLPEQRRIVARIEELAAKINEARGLRRKAAEEMRALSRSGVEQVFRRLHGNSEVRPLGDLCHSVTDGDHNTPQFSDEGVRFIFVGNVSRGRLHFENSKRVSSEYFNALSPQRVPKRGDILYSAVGATLGVPAVVDTDEPFCFQRHVAILKLDRHRVHSQFVWHMLRSPTVFEKAWRSTTGSAQPTVPLHAIRELPIPVPPLAEQRHIVAELDALQAKADALKKLQTETAAELDALLPSILDKAFKWQL